MTIHKCSTQCHLRRNSTPFNAHVLNVICYHIEFLSDDAAAALFWYLIIVGKSSIQLRLQLWTLQGGPSTDGRIIDPTIVALPRV